ncbi:hypothetical protein NKG94_32160 [Micromonospora sp. M12]
MNGSSRFSADLHRRFDIVSFDPRGTGGSHPVVCSRSCSPGSHRWSPTRPSSTRQWPTTRCCATTAGPHGCALRPRGHHERRP